MNTVDETVKCLPDGHMNGHVAAHAEAEAVIIPASESWKHRGATALERTNQENHR